VFVCVSISGRIKKAIRNTESAYGRINKCYHFDDARIERNISEKEISNLQLYFIFNLDEFY